MSGENTDVRRAKREEGAEAAHLWNVPAFDRREARRVRDRTRPESILAIKDLDVVHRERLAPVEAAHVTRNVKTRGILGEDGQKPRTHSRGCSCILRGRAWQGSVSARKKMLEEEQRTS